jgi:hypothetical protein
VWGLPLCWKFLPWKWWKIVSSAQRQPTNLGLISGCWNLCQDATIIIIFLNLCGVHCTFFSSRTIANYLCNKHQVYHFVPDCTACDKYCILLVHYVVSYCQLFMGHLWCSYHCLFSLIFSE